MKKIFSKLFAIFIHAELAVLLIAAPILLAVMLCLFVYGVIVAILSPFIPSVSDWSYMPFIYVGVIIGAVAGVHLFLGDTLKELFHIAPDSTLDRFFRSVWLILSAFATPFLAPLAALVIARFVYGLLLLFIAFYGMTFLISLIESLFFLLWIVLSVVGFGWILHFSIASAIDDIKQIYSIQKEEVMREVEYRWCINWGRGCGSEWYDAEVFVPKEEAELLQKVRKEGGSWKETAGLENSWKTAYDEAMRRAKLFVSDPDEWANIENGYIDILIQ